MAPVSMTRFQDAAKIETFIQEALPHVESLCPEIGSETWLMGGSDLTLIDIHCGATWESFYCKAQAPAFSEAKA